MSKYRASEYSSKVKVYNTVAENILKQKLNIYDRQERKNLQMIEKETRQFQEEIHGKNAMDSSHNTNTYDYNTFNGQELHKPQKKVHSKSKKRLRRKTRQQSLPVPNIGTEYKMNAIPEVRVETEKQSCLHHKRNQNRIKTKTYRSPCFLPDIQFPHLKENSDSSQTDSDVDHLLTLPPIDLTNAGLTASLSVKKSSKMRFGARE